VRSLKESAVSCAGRRERSTRLPQVFPTTHFTCFTSTKVQILTPSAMRRQDKVTEAMLLPALPLPQATAPPPLALPLRRQDKRTGATLPLLLLLLPQATASSPPPLALPLTSRLAAPASCWTSTCARCLRQYWHFCASKASKPSKSTECLVAAGGGSSCADG
jgi:hypothetical protein